MTDPFIENPLLRVHLLDRATESFCQGLDGLLNGAIHKVGGFMDACTTALREDTGKFSPDIMANRLDFGVGNKPFSESFTPDGPSSGRSPGKSIEPPNLPQHVKSLASSIDTKSMQCEHCDRGETLGNIAPMTMTAKVQTRSEGYSMGMA